MSHKESIQQEAIAIIGMACIFPQAPDLKAFWRNIVEAVDAIGEPLPEWEAERYLHSNRINTPFGGYLRDLYRFDPREFGIMPNSVDGGEPDQFLALQVARDALADAGYLGDGYDHRDTGIILGHSTYLHRGQANHIQHHIILDQTVELVQAMLPGLDPDRLTEIRTLLAAKLPPSNADIAPGLVPNVMTGRIANRLNLKGTNYLIDAACSSSLLAVGAAIDELRNHRSRMMLAGGVNASLPAEVTVIFTQLGALSERGKVRPFEKGSDGTLLGEGLGVVVLKRVSDALADGDRIYALLREVGQASDGRGHGLLAPSVEGEALAIKRAYAASGIDPATVGLVEAHGTGIPLGDQTEIAALKQVFGERKGDQGSVAVGSVKSMISHCIPAAGIAGLIKSALALHHKILPPTLCETVNPELDIEKTPFYVNTASRPWIAQPGIPRRAGNNSFGFGGINTHAILEEAPAEAAVPPKLSPWPAELCVFAAEDVEGLTDKLKRVARLTETRPDCPVADIAAALTSRDEPGRYRLAMVVKGVRDLVKKSTQAVKRLQNNTDLRWATRNGIVFSRSPVAGKISFMFPGEGSQYLGMFADLALCFDEVRQWFDFWRGLYDDLPGESRTDIIFPPPSELTENRRRKLEQRLHDMDVGSEAVFVGGQAMHGLLGSLGVKPDVMVGHSTGESSALAASGAIAADDTARLAGFIRELNQVYQRVLAEGKIPTGALLTVGALPQRTVEEHIAALDREVVIAMDNCSNQQVLFGDPEMIAALQKSLSNAGGICIPLPFDRGYHTPQFSAVSEAFLEYYQNIGLQAPQVPLYSCACADLIPGDTTAVRKLAAGQWSAPVRFRETVTRMHEDGVRYFIEVGPSGNLSAFVNDILAGKEYLALATDLRRKNGVEQFLTVLAFLYVNDKEVQLDRLFRDRWPGEVDFEKEMPTKPRGMLLSNTMPVVHITDADRAVLQKITGALPTADGPARAADQQPAGRMEEVSGALARRLDERARSGGEDYGWSGYFDLMRDFLAQQQAFFENQTEEQGSDLKQASLPDQNTPFLNSITELAENRLTGECHLSVYEDNFLRDHVLSGRVSEVDPNLTGLSCVPLMVSLEIMAEACALLAGDTAVRVIENIKSFDWIAVDDGELTLEVGAELIDPDSRTYRAQLFNLGAVAVAADFSFAGKWRAPGVARLQERRSYRWADHELYSTGMFHGPTFQSVSLIDGWNEEGIEASLSEVRLDGFFVEHETPALVLNPVLLDAIGQVAAYWIAQQVGTDFNSFPSTIERIELYQQCPQNVNGLTLRARQQPFDPAATGMEAPRVWQCECLDRQERSLFRVTNLVNIYFPVPHRFYEVRRDPLNDWLGRPDKTVGNALLWLLPHLSEEFCAQSGSIFLRILASALLNFEEYEEWRQLTANIRQRRGWLLGRICVKEAVRAWILHNTGRLLYPSDIVVRHDEHGAPYVDGWWNNNLTTAPGISLSHDRKVSVAAVTAPSQLVGVDIEHLDGIRRPDLIEGAMTAGERVQLHGLTGRDLEEKVLRIWCAKEAAAKYLGLGLQGRPDKFEVLFQDDAWQLAYVTYSGTVVEVDVRCENEAIIALATNHTA